ncbi:MAG: 50S ribosomal protein L23 [Candidatus Sungbacteria bacterium]|uniref:Large ribosomal subunit protein uL23 n=1 Tax=Candidatus Sungiibacteriota bacterium TaxID=2750080 RepID=A0A9D6LS31_9BACT|nr:50S ribosomal protein L23 [Candidatus Sungbacteria bacterium]
MGLFSRILGQAEKKSTVKKTEPVRHAEKHEEKVIGPETMAATSVKNAMAGMGMLGSPHMTEKTVRGSEIGVYTFRIPVQIGKVGLRKAIEDRYGVRVMSVNISKTPGKTRRLGRQMGHTAGTTKAVITLEKGKSLELGV